MPDDGFVYLTREGKDKLEAELKELKSVKRPELVRAISHARSLGDLSENAEYHAAKEAQVYLERRIAELEYMFSRARIIDENNLPVGEARLLAKVRLLELKSKEEEEYLLVTAEEADFDHGKLSIKSPIGAALLGKKEGDTVEVKVPAGVLRYKILSVTR
ncbi:MAG TPA: transcription elongation factor GreA [candidate division Zixibacteria bacterium]|nr:transcription elongation factor GreA [candidate division Zixibacteria bacterium]